MALALPLACAGHGPEPRAGVGGAAAADKAKAQPGRPARPIGGRRASEVADPGAAKTPGLLALEDELRRAMKALASQPVPPYFISYQVHDRHEVEIVASGGALLSSDEQRTRVLTPEVRVGSRKLDSTHASRGFDFGGYLGTSALLPLDDSPEAFKAVAWSATDKRYKAALERLLKIQAQEKLKVADEDPSDDFSEERPTIFIEAPVSLEVDRPAWAARVRRLSARFSVMPELRASQARLETRTVNRWLTNSEGSSVQTGRTYVRVMLQASVRADDGMDLDRYETFDAATLAGLPDEAVLLRAADTIMADLRAMRSAPLAEPFVGPAILDGKAAAVFFHEIFGHRVEGHRQKKDEEGQTFAKKIGEQVMPAFVSVLDDPLLERALGLDLNGAYRVDDEAVPAQRVTLVHRGVLRGFLMGRSPNRHFSKSNGHGRRHEGRPVVARQGNLIVEPTLAVTSEELRRRLRDEARRQGKPFGLLFKDIAGGFTNTGRMGPQTYKVLPILVYRVWVDGRPDELIRGVDLVGTPLASLSKIMAAGDDYQVFNGFCGAESGMLPVSAISPSLLVQQIEVERKEKGTEKPPVLAHPPAAPAAVSADGAVRQAMRDELARTLSDLHLAEQPRPYFAGYTVADSDWVQVGATLGSVTTELSGDLRTMRIDLRVGEPALDNSGFGGSGFGMLPLDDDYAALRRWLWLRTDEAYKVAVEALVRKKATAGGQAEGEDDLVPDFSIEPSATTVSLPELAPPALPPLRELARKLSAVFREYPAVSTSRATALHGVGRQRYLGSDQTWADERDGFVRLDLWAGTQADDGMPVRNAVAFTAGTVAELPAVAVMEKAVRAMADELRGMVEAPVGEGGDAVVLFEGAAAGQIVKRLLADQVVGMPPAKAGAFGRGDRGLGEKLGQPVTARFLSVYDDPRERHGPDQQLLLGSYHADDEGVPARRVSLIENGVLKTLLMSRTPSKEVRRSNGHGRSMRGGPARGHIGNLFVTAKGGLSRKALLARLAKEAKARGCEAYIVRALEDPSTGGAVDPGDYGEQMAFLAGGGGPGSVPPRVIYRLRNGKEELVRGITIDGVLPKSLKSIVAAGREPHVLNFIDGFGGSGLPSAIVTPALLFTDLEVRPQKDRHPKPPLYPHPSFAK